MKQGTKEWIEFRRSKIGASDAPVIMGVSPWKNSMQLWKEKVSLITKEDKPNSYQQRGLDLEQTACDYFFLMTGHEVKPNVIQCSKNEWMIASLDGICSNKKILLEIKCPGPKDLNLSLQGKIPDKYYPQLQHQLAVCNLEEGYYLSFNEFDGEIIKFKRDEKYIEKLIEKEFEFYQCVLNFTPPKSVIRKKRLSNPFKY